MSYIYRIMTLWDGVIENTLGEIMRYSAYLCKYGDREASMRCYMMLRGVNDNIQNMYYRNVLRPSLKSVVQKERMAFAYVATATCVVIWAAVMKDHVNLSEAFAEC